MARGLRVIAGSAGGMRLVAPKGARPTTDRVKESLFASLGDAVDGAVVLDLFAGSGALAIEALSRGAARALLVDRDRHAIDAIRRNLATTGFADRARAQASAAVAFLRRVPPEAPFDFVFCDPPYDLDAAPLDAVLAGLAAPGFLASAATVVLEARAGAGPALPAGWQVARQRTYGDTLTLVLTV